MDLPSIYLSKRCTLGDIRLWVGDPSSRRVERLCRKAFDIFLSCVPPLFAAIRLTLGDLFQGSGVAATLVREAPRSGPFFLMS